MPHYKTTENKLYFLDSEDFEHVLPEGCVKITDEEAAQITEANKPAPDLKAEARAYLASTDWFVVRFAETQVPVPAEVLEKRAAARLAI